MTTKAHRLRLGARLALFVWQPEANWTESDITATQALLRRVGSALGVLDEGAEDPWHPTASAYQWLAISHAMDAAAASLVGSHHREWPGYVARVTSGASTDAAVRAAKMHERINVNLASELALEALPGLGATSARRLVAHRESVGTITSLDEVKSAAEISNTAFNRLAPHVRVGSTRRAVDPPLVEAVRAGGVWALFGALRRGEISPSFLGSVGERARMLELAEKIAEAVESQRMVPRFWAPGDAQLDRGARALEQRRVLTADRGRSAQVSPVSSRAYQPLLHRMIAEATERIWAQMFFFSVGDPDTPGHKIVDALKAAVARGVDVRLILDDDLPGDYHGARNVNEKAFEVLKAAGVPTRRALPDRTAHGKAVLVDSQVLIGSHNWTASSFYRYEETSLYLVSVALADDLAHQHQGRWGALAAKASDRTIRLATLEQLSSQQRADALRLGVETGDQWYERTRRAAGRQAFAIELRMTETAVEQTRDCLRVMKDLRVSELTALALLEANLDTPAKIKRASREQLAIALADLSPLPPPFHLRRIPVGMIDYLWTAT